MIIDFTSCRRILHKAYNGANGKKIAIVYEGAVYMLKFPPSAEDKPTTLSYTNSCFSEHIGSRIFRLLGIDAQETLLGTYVVRGKTKIVCACRDFTIEKEGSGKIFYDFCSIKNTVIDSAHEGRVRSLSISKKRSVCSNSLRRMQSHDFSGACLSLMRCWAILIGTTATGDFLWILLTTGERALHRFLTVAALCCPRPTRRQ